MITIITFFCLASAFLAYGLGVAAYSRNPKSATNRLFVLAMLAGCYWAFAEFMIWQATTMEGVRFWLKMSSFWPFVIAFIVHFVLLLTDHRIYRTHRLASLAVIYLPALAISLILLLTDWIYTIIFLPDTGFVYLPVRESIAYQAEALYNLLIMLFATAVIISYWMRAGTTNARMQAKLICWAFLTVIVFGSLSGIILPALGIYRPNLVFIGIVLFSLFITIAISKHELFVLNPATAVPDILRTIPDAIILTDMEGTIISANDASSAILGTGCCPLQGKKIAACLPESVFDSLHLAISEKGHIADLEVTPSASPASTVSIAGSLVHDPDGKPAGMVLVVRDITDRKRATRALQIAGEKLGLLTQITRHDINNLVSALSGYLLLLKEEPNDPENSTYVEACMEIAKRIHEQIQFTREYQEIGARQPVWQSLDQILTRASEDIPHEGVPIERHPAPVEIFCDPMMVKVFYNLFENALRHGERITRIALSSAEGENGILSIVVEDDGVGIPQEEKESIFRYGYGKNTGLGLAISRDILALTGITISETGKPGSGARFEISVPPSAWRRFTQ